MEDLTVLSNLVGQIKLTRDEHQSVMDTCSRIASKLEELEKLQKVKRKASD